MRLIYLIFIVAVIWVLKFQFSKRDAEECMKFIENYAYVGGISEKDAKMLHKKVASNPANLELMIKLLINKASNTYPRPISHQDMAYTVLMIVLKIYGYGPIEDKDNPNNYRMFINRWYDAPLSSNYEPFSSVVEYSVAQVAKNFNIFERIFDIEAIKDRKIKGQLVYDSIYVGAFKWSDYFQWLIQSKK